ncbi:MAG TPA: DUF2202 domain-containing protein [Spongiibacteraceae bacterium]|nr:DUF2202 domain-containing protein [Spongiibacteraceae bacterium]
MKSSSTLASAAALTLALLGSGQTYAERTAPLSEEETTDLLFMREEEKLARDTYLVLFEKWKLPVFSNIASSEQSHMDAILKLLEKYRLNDPAKSTAIGEFTNEKLQALYNMLIDAGEASRLEALKVGGIIEESDMRDIMASIERSQHADIDAVFENLICGSRNHLRAFAQNIVSTTGQAYVAQVLTQPEVDAIINSPMEKCGH